MRAPLAKFFADRGPHVAAMIAYFALLSFVPLVFLALALFGLTGRVDESSYLVTELKSMFPSRSFEQIVRVVQAIQDNATTLGVVGGILLVWSSLSLFSVLESAFNIVYGRPNRSFLHGKLVAIVLLLGSLVVLFVGLVVGTIGFEFLTRYAGGVVDNEYVAYILSVLASSAAVLVFVVAIYYLLTNVKLTVHEVLPGALLATIVLQTSFQVLPLYLRLTDDLLALQAFGGLPILLIWLYVMANVLVFGAEVNWWLARGRFEAVQQAREEAAGLA
ncbi:MAG: YihY/virulence factor BrkB family protein [Thermoleophilia bacterium]|nr:YihY/virulence factor BrkB family protein [Thermoleophilia bacterium]